MPTRGIMLTMHLIKEDIKSYCGTALLVLQFRHSPNQYLKKTKNKHNRHNSWVAGRKIALTSATAWSADSIFSKVINAQLDRRTKQKRKNKSSSHYLYYCMKMQAEMTLMSTQFCLKPPYLRGLSIERSMMFPCWEKAERRLSSPSPEP